MSIDDIITTKIMGDDTIAEEANVSKRVLYKLNSEFLADNSIPQFVKDCGILYTAILYQNQGLIIDETDIAQLYKIRGTEEAVLKLILPIDDNMRFISLLMYDCVEKAKLAFKDYLYTKTLRCVDYRLSYNVVYLRDKDKFSTFRLIYRAKEVSDLDKNAAILNKILMKSKAPGVQILD